MNVPTRLAGFALGLVALVGIGAAVGAGIGPTVSAPSKPDPPPVGQGVVSAEAGFRLLPSTTRLPNAGGVYRFVILGNDGQPVREFTPLHRRALHLIVVNRELSNYHHVHPTMTAGGTWSVELPALRAGSYRVVADFSVAHGPRLALGTDLTVAGSYQPIAPPGPSGRASVDGYKVHLASSQGRDGVDSISFTVHRAGQLVTDLQPYLGAAGHLVAMRAGDLAYEHVHPLQYADGTVHFEATLPSAGRYRLFFDFKHANIVRTAAFTFDQGLVTGTPPAMDQ